MANSQDLIGQGMGMAMDQIYRMLFGNAVGNLRQGQPVSGGDVLDSAFTVGMNSLPFGAGGAAAKTVPALDQLAAQAVLNRTLRNPQFSVAMPRFNAIQAIQQGAYKNKFERGMNDSYRAGIEERVLNIPRSTPASERPIYGALTSKTVLPAGITKKIPGKTGEAIRMVNPIANESLSLYRGGDGVIASVPTKGLPTTYTTTDSFYAAPNSVRRVGDKSARREAVKEIMDMLNNNSYRPSAQFIEGQIPSNLNALSKANKFYTFGTRGAADETSRDIMRDLIGTGRAGRDVKVSPVAPREPRVKAPRITKKPPKIVEPEA